MALMGRGADNAPSRRAGGETQATMDLRVNVERRQSGSSVKSGDKSWKASMGYV